MTVAWILRDKGRKVVSVLPRTSLNEAITLLAQNKIGALVIADEQNRVLGILSERDVVRLLASKGACVLDEAISEHMTRPVVTCGEHHSIDWLMGEMTANRFRHIPVTKQGKLAGIVSIGDVVKFKLALAESEAEQMRRYVSAG
jgi:CBS domain-containing protein